MKKKKKKERMKKENIMQHSSKSLKTSLGDALCRKSRRDLKSLRKNTIRNLKNRNHNNKIIVNKWADQIKIK
jgi:hypothetical protein